MLDLKTYHRGKDPGYNAFICYWHVVQEQIEFQDAVVLEVALDLAGVSTPPFSPQLLPGALTKKLASTHSLCQHHKIFAVFLFHALMLLSRV